MNGEPLIEKPDAKVSDRFRAMADRIERNPSEFGGAVVIVPPGGGDPIEFLLVDPKSDLGQFFGTLKAKIELQLSELQDRARAQQQGWR